MGKLSRQTRRNSRNLLEDWQAFSGYNPPMRYFFKINKPKSDLPMDQDRNLMGFRLVECPVCKKKGASVLHVSTMDPGRGGTPELRRRWSALRRMASDDEAERWPFYEAFANQFHLEFPELFVSPGMEFGVLQISVHRIVDLCTPGLGVMVLKKDLFNQMHSRGLGMESWPVRARYSKRIMNPVEIVELVALPLSSAASGQGIQLCPFCNRSNYDGGRTVLGFTPCKMSLASVPPGLDAFRIKECPLNVIVSERFVNELEGLDCGNVQWAQVETD